MVELYSEEIKEAVAANINYLDTENIDNISTFLEAVSESLYEGELLEKLAAAIRDVADGV